MENKKEEALISSEESKDEMIIVIEEQLKEIDDQIKKQKFIENALRTKISEILKKRKEINFDNLKEMEEYEEIIESNVNTLKNINIRKKAISFFF